MSAVEAVDEPVVMETAPLPDVSFEVTADFVELVDADGHKHWLAEGDELPAWVSADHVAELLLSGAVFGFGRI